MKRAVVLILLLGGYWFYLDNFFFQAQSLTGQLEQRYLAPGLERSESFVSR